MIPISEPTQISPRFLPRISYFLETKSWFCRFVLSFYAASTDFVSKQVTLLLGIAEEDGSGRRYSFLGALFAGLSLVELSW